MDLGELPLAGSPRRVSVTRGGTQTFTLLATPHLALIGLELHHAFVVTDASTGAVRFVSNPVRLRLGP